jgi:hypothetical protein
MGGHRQPNFRGDAMLQFKEAPASEHDLYLRLFITNGGGW